MDSEEQIGSSQTRRQQLRLDLGSTHGTRLRGGSFSLALPSVIVSTSPTSPSLPVAPLSSENLPPTVTKARGELRKLLAHLLSRLKTRPPAPSLYDGIRADSARKESHRLGAVVETVRSAVRLTALKDPNDRLSDDDDTMEDEQYYSTDVTYNFMSQLRDVLIMSARQGWQIFETMDAEAISYQKDNSSVRRLRRNSRQLGQRSRSPSPSGISRFPDLLMECINVIASVISEDCRFKLSSSRIFRPPYSLQAVTLDVAQSLINAHRHDAKILSRIGFAMIPAFSSFNSALHTRLLAFFEDGIIRGMLEDLRSCQGSEVLSKKGFIQEDAPLAKTPVVAIQVEEAAGDSPSIPENRGWLQWSSTSTSTLSNFLSAVAPSQPMVVYHLSSLVPPLLAAILEAIDPFEDNIKDIPRLHRLHTLLRTIVSTKRDAYLDILEIVGYHGPQTRRKALAILATFWPKAVGHIVIGKSLPVAGLHDSLSNQIQPTKLRYAKPPRDHPYAHAFMPWRFFRQDSASASDYGILLNSCQSCYSVIIGFGLLCPFCLTSIHLNCYDAPDATFHGQYLSVPEKQPRQCIMSFSNVLPFHRDAEPPVVIKAQHAFRMANLFTLALCLVCRKPLWGPAKQGMKCSSCMQFAHSSCMSSTNPDTFPSCADFALSESHVMIDLATLRQTFVDHYRDLLIIEKELPTKTYEEVSIFYSILWTQLRILENGIVYKSIIVDRTSQENHVDEFELQYFVRLYEVFLSSGKLAMSSPLQEYYELNKGSRFNEHSVLFDWPLLSNVTSIIKAPLSVHAPAIPPHSSLLHVNDYDVESPDQPSHPCELTLLSQMRKILGREFHINSDCAARYMLSQISLIGFFDRTDPQSDLFDETIFSESFCLFPLPLGLDLSTSVETLVVAIEACLRDIDIAVNEHGFLLLVRRFWPTGAASEYALTRLTKIVLSWVLTEDDRLVIIARDHTALNLSLPGVRTTSDTAPWPPASRASSGTHSGGEYVFCRKQLLVRHALPWLVAVHALDVLLYSNCLYDHCVEVADASDSCQVTHSLYLPQRNSQLGAEGKTAWCETVLRSIIKLAQSNVTLSSFETVLMRWLDSAASLELEGNSIAFRSLPRLFNHEGDSTRRTSTMNDPLLGLSDPIQTDPWKIFDNALSEGLKGLERSLLWLRVMSHSAVDIPVKTLKRMFGTACDLHASFHMVVSLLESTMKSTWLKTFGSTGLDLLMAEVHHTWADDLLRRLQSTEDMEEVHDFLRYSLATCLLMYGCERHTITSLGLIRLGEVRDLTQRRKARGVSAVPDVLEINPKLVSIISRYAIEGSDTVCAFVAKFFYTLVSESALLESHEIDRFILVNGSALSQCAWKFYDLGCQDLNEIRTNFLIRILVVDPQPFDALLDEVLRIGGQWQVRFRAITRLFQIVLDVVSPSFRVEGRHWKSSVTDIFNHFFRALWEDDCEEIQMAVDTLTHTLLPAHLQAISSCWDEQMSKSPISDRAKLSAFLIQLHPHFPVWNLLSWETIVELLLDADFAKNNGDEEDGYATAAHLSANGYALPSKEQPRTLNDDDQDIATLRVTLVLLSLQMIADGANIDLVHLLKIKLILVKVIGFSSTSLRPTASGQGFHVQFGSLEAIPEISFVCIGPLMRVLDAPHTLTIPPSSMGVAWNENPVPGLVGDVFIDIVGSLWENGANVQNLPYSVLRALLESVLLIIMKHDLNSPTLKSLDEMICRAVKTVTDLVVSDRSYDLRHLCLSVMQTFMRDYPMLALRILGYQVSVLTRLVVSLHFSTEDTLVLQTKEFLETAFVQYEVSGLFWLLSKQGRMSDDFFMLLRNVVNGASSDVIVPGETLRDSIVRDTLSKVAANTSDRAIPDVLYNLEKYVSICHHQSFPPSLIQHIGLRLTAIARQTSDFVSSTLNRSPSTFDPNPLLLMAARIVQHNKAQSLDLLLHTETLLRAALVRFEVHQETLDRLLHVVSTTYRRRKSADINGAELPKDHIALGVLEILSDSLKGKTRVLPLTMTTMLEALMSLHDRQDTYIPVSTVIRTGVEAVSYLSYPFYRETHGQAEFTASLSAAKLILHISNYDPLLLQHSLAGDTRNPSPVRVWNLIVLAALRSVLPDASKKLIALLPSFALAYTTSLRVPLSGVMSESIAPNVNHAFASVKLWMLMARKSCHDGLPGDDVASSDTIERVVWNELWPPFEGLLVRSLADGPNGEMPPLSTFVWGCISDLVLFVRQARSIVALETSSHASILNKLRASRGEAAGSKFSRALRSISEAPADLSFDILVAQVTNDVSAAEKLQAVEVYRQVGSDKRRETTDRRRVDRDVRTIS